MQQLDLESLCSRRGSAKSPRLIAGKVTRSLILPLFFLIKTPTELVMTITKEVLIYANLPPTKFRWIGYVAFAQIGFIGLNFLVLPTQRIVREREEAIKNKVIKKQITTSEGETIERWEPNPDYDSATILQRLWRLDYYEIFNFRNFKDNIAGRPYMTAGMTAAAILVAGSLSLLVKRNIHKITLLPNERVRITVFPTLVFKSDRSMEMSLRDISCVQPRNSEHRYSILKLRGYRMFHLVEKQEENFIEPQLYDQYLSYERSWAAKSN